MLDFASKLSLGLTYDEFLQRHATDQQRAQWQQVYDRVRLTRTQRKLLAAFRRRMPMLCLAGAWCGDCVEQCPVLQRFAEVCSLIELRFFDRDTHADLRDELAICGGQRVPVVVFLSEDGFPVSRFGDRTLSRYRALAKQLYGDELPIRDVPPEKLQRNIVQEWLNEVERVQWLLCTSPRLRARHGETAWRT